MDQKRIDEIRAREQAATPGPWTTAGVDRRPFIHNTWRVQDEKFYNLANFIDTEDAAFIAAARQDVPDLLDEVERLQHALDEIEGLVGPAIAIPAYAYADNEAATDMAWALIKIGDVARSALEEK